MTHGYGEEYDINGILLYKGDWHYNERITKINNKIKND